ncbi:MAG: hypothetical protein ACOX2Q_05060 [Dehalobacterium sp.]|jgi:hypothetical protein
MINAPVWGVLYNLINIDMQAVPCLRKNQNSNKQADIIIGQGQNSCIKKMGLPELRSDQLKTKIVVRYNNCSMKKRAFIKAITKRNDS